MRRKLARGAYTELLCHDLDAVTVIVVAMVVVGGGRGHKPRQGLAGTWSVKGDTPYYYWNKYE